LEGCKQAALAGWEILKQGGSALDAAEAAVVVLEDNPLFNAGTGSTLNSLGKVEMDAAIMEGIRLQPVLWRPCGHQNPIKLARRVMEDGRHVPWSVKGTVVRAPNWLSGMCLTCSSSKRNESAGKSTARSAVLRWTV
jgi:beta-aspartyl-peptidase (threonine type)